MIEPIERGDTLADQAYDRLRSALASGTFKPGKSVSIRQLARLLNISATPARDAISRALWERGLEAGPQRTVVVPSLTVANLHDLYAIQINLEGLATELATPHFTGQSLRQLEALLKAYQRAMEKPPAASEKPDYGPVLQVNENFHFYIYEKSGNPLLVEMIRSLWLKMGPSMHLLRSAYLKNRTGLEHHTEILKALRTGDPRAARDALIADLRDGRAVIEKVLSGRGDEPDLVVVD